MSLSNKELLDIKNKLADEHGWLNWEAIPASTFKDELWDIVCERFATEKAKELLPKEKKEPTPTKYSNDPVLIKYEYPEQVSPVESQEELFEAFFADFQERYAFQVPYNGTNEFYNQKKLDQAESFKVDMKFAWDKIVQEDIKQLMSDQDILANDLKNTLEREEALIESVNELESENKLLREEIERLKAEVLREKFPPN